jgi:hypothetical protein
LVSVCPALVRAVVGFRARLDPDSEIAANWSKECQTSPSYKGLKMNTRYQSSADRARSALEGDCAATAFLLGAEREYQTMEGGLDL